MPHWPPKKKKMCLWKAQTWKMFGRDILSDWFRDSSYDSSALLNKDVGVIHVGSDRSCSDYLGKLLNHFGHQFPHKNIRDNNCLYFTGWLWWFDEIMGMKTVASGTWFMFKKRWPLWFFVFQEQPILCIEMWCLLHYVKIIAMLAFLSLFLSSFLSFLPPSLSSLSLNSSLPPSLLSFFTLSLFLSPNLCYVWLLSTIR